MSEVNSALVFNTADMSKEEKDSLVELVASQYTNEPCRICGENISMEDMRNGAVFAGYSADSKSRAAHKECWDKNIPQSEWKHQ